MLKSIEESPLFRIANPKSIVFFEASNNISSMGTNQLLSILALGFEGPIYPVHPREPEVQRLRAYRSVLDLPEVPDLAVLVLPARIVNPTLEECGRMGIKHAIVVSGGFREMGRRGLELERDLLAIARKRGMRVLGPNCIGVANPHHKLNTTFLQHVGNAGFIGMASQSGSFVTQMFDYLSRLGLGFSTAFSVGNEADINMADCLDYLGACPHTRAIALYIEDIKQGRRFIERASTIALHKPIVALYVGGSDAGKRASLSHTGALAGPERLYDGVFRQSGILRARSVAELFDFCWALGSLPEPKGNRVVIQTHSGGPGAAAADACGRAGLVLPMLSEHTTQRLAPFVPATGNVNNPVDLTFTKNPMEYFHDVPNILLDEEDADMLLTYFLLPQQRVKRALEQMGLSDDQAFKKSKSLIDAQCESIARLLASHHKPLAGFTFRSYTEYFVRGLLERGVPVFDGPERAARALAALIEYTELRKRLEKVSL